MLVLEHLVKDYPGGIRALEDVSIEVRDGEFLVLIGLSGSGKSTLLRCVNRLVEPTGGRIMLDDVDITAARGSDLRKIRRSVGMIFQQFNLVKRSTVLTNVLTGRLGYVSQWQGMLGHFGEQDYRRALANLNGVGLGEGAPPGAAGLPGGSRTGTGLPPGLMPKPKWRAAAGRVAGRVPAP